MSQVSILTGCLMAIVLVPCASMAQIKTDAKTPSSVIAVDNAWGAAEESGDSAFVERLLAPEYRSIGADGQTTDRAAILSRVHGPRDPGRAERIAAYKASHPSQPSVTLVGDTAVLTWVSQKPGAAIYSCDVFVYRNGHWQAVYSQHTNAA